MAATSLAGLRKRLRYGGIVAGILVLIAAANSGCSSAATPKKAAKSGPKPTMIIPAPAGVMAITSPQVSGTMWVLAGNRSVKTVTGINAATGNTQQRNPASAQSGDVALTVSGVLLVAVNGPTSGAVQAENPVTRKLINTIPTAAPVIDLAPSPSGPQFYALVGTTKARAVELLAPGTPKVVQSIPVDNRAVAIQPLADGSGIWVLLSTGTVQEVSATTGHVLTSFGTGGRATTLALSPDGKILYVLRGLLALSIAPRVGSNVAVVDLGTEQVTHVLPAPAHCVDIAISADGRTLYDAVGTAKFGNIQAYALAG